MPGSHHPPKRGPLRTRGRSLTARQETGFVAALSENQVLVKKRFAASSGARSNHCYRSNSARQPLGLGCFFPGAGGDGMSRRLLAERQPHGGEERQTQEKARNRSITSRDAPTFPGCSQLETNLLIPFSRAESSTSIWTFSPVSLITRTPE